MTQRDDAESAIQHLAGVQRIENEIAVKAPKELRAGDVQHAIHAALERRSARESDRLKVEIAGGTVTLSGAVHSWAERKTAIGAARGTPGVCHVEDHLRIEP